MAGLKFQTCCTPSLSFTLLIRASRSPFFQTDLSFYFSPSMKKISKSYCLEVCSLFFKSTYNHMSFIQIFIQVLRWNMPMKQIFQKYTFILPFLNKANFQYIKNHLQTIERAWECIYSSFLKVCNLSLFFNQKPIVLFFVFFSLVYPFWLYGFLS